MAVLTRGSLPTLYAILDAEAVDAAGRELFTVALDLCRAGVKLLQYRDKRSTSAKVLANARRIRELFDDAATLILNDAPELCVQAAWDGVHVGQGDASVAEARRIVGGDRIVGVSTHGAAQVREAQATDADYIAIGPIYTTSSKRDTEPEVGLAGLAEARELTSKPLVAIGGINSARMQAVLAAGADTVAVIGALLAAGASVEENVQRLMRPAQHSSA